MSRNNRNSGTALGDRLQQQVQQTNGNSGAPAIAPNPTSSIKSLLSAANVKKRFDEILDKRAPQFMASIVNLVSMEKSLQNVDPISIIGSALVAATMDLPIDKNLGYAWIVPYKGKAQFQMGYKGYIQLALRTGKYKSINAIEVYEGELGSWNRLTEQLEIYEEKRISEKVIGYAGYFELVNGFKKTVYWSREEIEAHRIRFSKSEFGWKNDYDGMGLKTVIRNMLGKWGILSIEMQDAHRSDMQAIEAKSDENTGYIDITYEPIEDDTSGDNKSPVQPPTEHQEDMEFEEEGA